MTQQADRPKKIRELYNHTFDSSLWNDFDFRPDDVVVGSYAKSGTTWTQQIVAQLIFGGAENLPINEISPQVEFRVAGRDKLKFLKHQQHRRILKTHLPLDALVYTAKAKYIYIARDGRDVALSLYYHHVNAADLWFSIFNDTPGRVGHVLLRPRGDAREYFLDWLDYDGYPLWSYWENISSWWQMRHVPNLMLLHYNDLKSNLAGEIRRIARFLEIETDEAIFPIIVHHCTFDYMKKNARDFAPLGDRGFKGGAQNFIRAGVSGGWRTILTADDAARYDEFALRKLGEECAQWLRNGRLQDEPLASTAIETR